MKLSYKHDPRYIRDYENLNHILGENLGKPLYASVDARFNLLDGITELHNRITTLLASEMSPSPTGSHNIDWKEEMKKLQNDLSKLHVSNR